MYPKNDINFTNWPNMKWINRIFGKNNEESKIADGFFRTKEDIVVNADVAFKPSVKQAIDDVRKKLLVTDDDYKNLNFDDNLDLHDYNLSDLSDEAKVKIIEIIKEDSKKRIIDNQARIQKVMENDLQKDDDEFGR